MKVYIALDHKEEPIGLLLADNQEKAAIAWAAMGEYPHHIEEIDPTTKVPNGVAFLLTSSRTSSHDYSHKIGGFEFRKWRRGVPPA